MMDWWAFQTLYFTFLENKLLIQGKEKRFSCLPGFEQAGATCILSSVASNLTCIIQICYWPIGHCSKSTSMTQKVPVSSRLLGRTFVACHLVSGVYSNKKHYYSMSFFLPFNWPRVHTWPANNCLQIMVCSCLVPSKCVLLQIIFCSCVIGTMFWREKWQVASLNCQKVIKTWKQTWRSNDKTITELCYHKMSWLVSVSQINFLPQPSALANILICLPTSSNNC